MAEPLKNMYSQDFLEQFGRTIKAVYPSFSIEDFVQKVFADGWQELELKGRIRKITCSLKECLPVKYEEAIEILLVVHNSCSGFPYLILPDFVEVFGQDDQHWELSMRALETFTQHSSAEFAVRPFIIHDPERMMKQMLRWAESSNEHIRRLASEGCRPRLPWGQALTMFKQDPAPILLVLELLKEDSSLYVRKSVANNLNDIAKDHPNIVIDIAQRWMGKHPHTDWIVRHACRTLIRSAEPEVMKLFGYADTKDGSALTQKATIAVNPIQVQIGDSSELQYEIYVREGEPVRIRIEYGIDFVKSSGKVSRKKFLLSDKTVDGGSHLQASRTHRWADLTTRRHYPGQHKIVLLVNGQEVAHTQLLLINAHFS
ncbi:3-methyladenine DNA glycosylase AlkC [Fontibacillus panacisegetis]|uniref:3-methyladenine DNA glycosylase AlkC n=1 Tax=Fontibacillus panacisegetis TaxID=670482 RepID=A0A1G7E767_9BACL|nr:DNA alkylation repair protein [Fontibacillus panacisegetis]SDE59459.1 3-methyladenine DNA glycosylase AlkC [Fontibacillus panacisegetis]